MSPYRSLKAIPLFIFQLVCSVPWTTWIGLIALSVFFWLGIFGHQGLYELEHLRQTRATLLLEEKGLLDEKAQLEKELKLLEDPLYMKHLIHQELGYTEKDEILVQFPSLKRKKFKGP